MQFDGFIGRFSLRNLLIASTTFAGTIGARAIFTASFFATFAITGTIIIFHKFYLLKGYKDKN